MGIPRMISGALSLLYMVLIIITVPLAFDVGGVDCGISYTFTLVVYYFVMTTLRLVSRRTKISVIGSLLYYSQHIVLPTLLIIHLSIAQKRAQTKSGQEDRFLPGLVPQLVVPWRLFVEFATPVFTTTEGFCTLLCIQATGQITRRLSRKSDIWMFIQIALSGTFLSLSTYFLYHIYTLPGEIDLASASLIGAVVTIALGLSLFGILSGRGCAIEASLLISYVVYCLYIMFTDFQSHQTSSSWSFNSTFLGGSSDIVVPPLPPTLINGYSSISASIASMIPQSFVTVGEFFVAVMATVSPSVLFSLLYRLAVFYAATRIIPVLASSTSQHKSRTILFLVYAYSPIIIIAEYTHLLMQHIDRNNSTPSLLKAHSFAQLGIQKWFTENDIWGISVASWQLWGWVNILTFLTLYALELIYGDANLIDNRLKKE